MAAAWRGVERTGRDAMAFLRDEQGRLVRRDGTVVERPVTRRGARAAELGGDLGDAAAVHVVGVAFAAGGHAVAVVDEDGDLIPGDVLLPDEFRPGARLIVRDRASPLRAWVARLPSAVSRTCVLIVLIVSPCSGVLPE